MKLFGKPDWRWVGVSYCLFVVFHMLPTILMVGFFRSGMGIGWNIGTVIWLFFGLALIGGYVGYKSAGVTIVEPAISSVAYVLTLMLSLRSVWNLPVSLKLMLASGVVILASIAIVLVSAWVGELLQVKKQAKEIK